MNRIPILLRNKIHAGGYVVYLLLGLPRGFEDPSAGGSCALNPGLAVIPLVVLISALELIQLPPHLQGHQR